MGHFTIMGTVFVSLFAGMVVQPAEAFHRKHHRAAQGVAYQRDLHCVANNDGQRVCSDAARSLAMDANGNSAARVADAGTVIGGRPAGCPNRYCGCGLRLYLGLADKRLNLASNWARLFPHVAGPAAGVAAVRSGHVMYIEGSAGNGQWLVRDYNSGGGLSRVHVRSVRGYTFVNPHAALASR